MRRLSPQTQHAALRTRARVTLPPLRANNIPASSSATVAWACTIERNERLYACTHNGAQSF